MPDWSVLILREGENEQLPFDDEEASDRLSDLLEALEEFFPSVSTRPDYYAVQTTVDAPDAETAIAKVSPEVLGASSKAGLPDWPITAVEVKSWSRFERELEQPTFPKVLGVAEIAKMLGVTRQRASVLARSGAFPKPYAELAAGPIWLDIHVKRFVDEWKRRPGRPRRAPKTPVEIEVAAG